MSETSPNPAPPTVAAHNQAAVAASVEEAANGAQGRGGGGQERVMSETDPRKLLAQADRAKEVAQWADSMRCTIRLGRPVKVSQMHQRGPFGRKRKYLYELDDRMPSAAVDALYRALAMVRDEANAEAYVCEQMVTTASTQDPS